MRNIIRSSGILTCAALFAVVAVQACSGNADKSGSSTETSGAHGDVNLKLTLDSGVELAEVAYTISGGALGAGETIVGNIPVLSEYAEITAYVYGLVAAEGYAIELTATTEDGLTHCGGSATFDVLAGGLTAVQVPFTCGLINADRGAIGVSVDMNECPVIELMSLAPVRNEQGYLSVLRSRSTDANPDALTYAWTTDYGTLATPTAANTDFRCSCPAATPTLSWCENHITLTVNDGEGCVVAQNATAECYKNTECGNGVVETEGGEQCEPPNTATCNAQCLNIECGDGRVDPGEQCDPPQPGFCSTSCQEVAPECGDGFVNGTEECDPAAPGTPVGTCSDVDLDVGGVTYLACHSIPIACGNGLVQQGEECEPPNTATCDAQCQSLEVTPCEICINDHCSYEQGASATLCDANDEVRAEYAAYAACLETSGCADTQPVSGCFCGSQTDPDLCWGFDADFALLDGACKNEISALANSQVPLTIAARFFDISTCLGATNQIYECRDTYCTAEPENICY
ncbi:MAG: hypothetical protein JW751_29505 [Polyangiaceae bacterium]|nr:hypothetical protein [Polyangiaceae bacterium]